MNWVVREQRVSIAVPNVKVPCLDWPQYPLDILGQIADYQSKCW